METIAAGEKALETFSTLMKVWYIFRFNFS
jgi:hypothetical protein